MGENNPTPDWDLKARDKIILSELSKDTKLTASEIQDRLSTEHKIDVSRVTVSESIREMREAEVFRETIIPNEEYLFFSLFEYKFHPPSFEESWRPAMKSIRDDEHTLLFFLSDGEYQWKSIMIFKDREQESRWIHKFYKRHGDLFNNVRNTVVTNVLKFDTHPKVFSTLLQQWSL